MWCRFSPPWDLCHRKGSGCPTGRSLSHGVRSPASAVSSTPLKSSRLAVLVTIFWQPLVGKPYLIEPRPIAERKHTIQLWCGQGGVGNDAEKEISLHERSQERILLSASEIERCHFSSIPDKESSVGESGYVPRLSVNGRRARHFVVPVRRRIDEYEFSVLGQDD